MHIEFITGYFHVLTAVGVLLVLCVLQDVMGALLLWGVVLAGIVLIALHWGVVWPLVAAAAVVTAVWLCTSHVMRQARNRA